MEKMHEWILRYATQNQTGPSSAKDRQKCKHCGNTDTNLTK